MFNISIEMGFNIFAATVNSQTPTILFEDNHIIAVNKPAGWLVQGDATGDKPLSDWVKDYIKQKYQKPGDVYLGVLHRIDRPVSGIVLFARTSKAAERMSKAIQQRQLSKIYIAEIKGVPAHLEATLEHFIVRNESNNTSKAYTREVPNSKDARLYYKVIERRGKNSLVEIDLDTGRHHQIRVQFSSIQCPIVGDVKYGYPSPNSDGSINLHAYKVQFEHPVKKEMIEIRCEPPF